MNFQYQISEDDYLEACKLFEKYRKKTAENIVGSIIGFVCVIFVFQTNNTKPAIAIACGCIVLAFYSAFMGKKRLKLEYAHHAFIKQMMNFTLTDEGYSLVSEGSSTFLRWERIYRYVENDKFWLLYISPHLMHIVPKSAVSDSDAKQISDSLKQHIGERGEVESSIKYDKNKDDEN